MLTVEDVVVQALGLLVKGANSESEAPDRGPLDELHGLDSDEDWRKKKRTPEQSTNKQDMTNGD